MEEHEYALGYLKSIQPSRSFLDGVHAAALALISDSRLTDENTFTIPKVPGVSPARPIVWHAPRAAAQNRGDQQNGVISKANENEVGSTALVVYRGETFALSSESSTTKQRIAVQDAATGGAGDRHGGGGGKGRKNTNQNEHCCPIHVTSEDLLVHQR